ncbi:MAG: hypothetical protein ACYTF9_02445, partial [Planctomycetota bacterium]
QRMDFLADLPRDELAKFKRLLPPEDIKKLNRHIDLRVKQAKRPTVESWLADARAGKATTTEAMVEVLGEITYRLHAQDVTWLRRLKDVAAPSRKQSDVIRRMYRKYFDPNRGAND